MVMTKNELSDGTSRSHLNQLKFLISSRLYAKNISKNDVISNKILRSSKVNVPKNQKKNHATSNNVSI